MSVVDINEEWELANYLMIKWLQPITICGCFGVIAGIEQAFVCCVVMKNVGYINFYIETN